MKTEKTIRRKYEKLERLHKSDLLSDLEVEQMKTLEWVVHDEE